MRVRSVRLPTARIRAVVPVVLAPVAIGTSAVLASLARLSTFGVLLVALVVGVLGAAVAHRTVSSLLTGAMLLLARPFEPGDRLRVHVPRLGPADVEVMRIGLLTSTLCTGSGVLVIANRDLLAAPSAPG